MKGIQLNSDYDLLIKPRRDAQGLIVQGLVIGDVTYQNQAILLQAHKGEIKEFPTIGVGIEDITNDNEFGHWERLITEELEKDGQQIEKLSITADGLKLEAKYK